MPLSHLALVAATPPDTDGGGYGFLIGHLVDSAAFGQARLAARGLGCAPHEVLLAEGTVRQVDYVTALAASIGAACLPAEAMRNADLIAPALAPYLIDAVSHRPGEVAAEVARRRGLGQPAVLAPRATLDLVRQRTYEAAWLDEATFGLLHRAPVLSSRTATWLWQPVALVLAVGAAIGGAIVATDATLALLTALLVVPFFFIVAIRLAALVLPPARRPAAASARPVPPGDLPVYTVLVPLYRERRALAGLTRALLELDYPRTRLDILLIVEHDDRETRAALEALELPACFRAVVVPPGQPRTKPRALNFALHHARGTFVTVYDAEDAPEPDQLRMALAAFAADPARTVCVQACLNIDDPAASWLTRQFAIEYSVLFDRLLPALVRLGLPVPLGGTSNHFPRAVLERAGGWDPYNVTEDADLGMRLARDRGRVAVIASTTWEEAPPRLGPWLRQRTRWIKGWMQTYLVHMRRPLRLARELGPWGFLGFQAVMGGFLFSALVHPLFYLMAAIKLAQGSWFDWPQGVLGQTLWWIAGFNLATGYLAALALAVVAVSARGRPWLALSALAMPVYWLAISLAAYRALIQLVTDPFRWEKTEHSARVVRGPARARRGKRRA